MTEKKTPGQRGADKSPRKPRADKGKKRGIYQTGTDERVRSYTVSIYPSQKNTAVEIYGSLKKAVLHAITNK